jgi:hypothetical protein
MSLLVMSGLLLLSFSSVAHGAKEDSKIEKFLDVLAVVESGNRDVTGDNGKAIGHYQIWRVYWQDSGIKGSYSQCHNREYSRRVVMAYWQRYCPQAVKSHDWQTLARIHNGGPNGASKRATVAYWRRVQAEMKRQGM